jgi:hypothetical protein
MARLQFLVSSQFDFHPYFQYAISHCNSVYGETDSRVEFYVAVVLARCICFCTVYVKPLLLVCCVTNMPANVVRALLRIL